jgi:hypothetical protein
MGASQTILPFELAASDESRTARWAFAARSSTATVIRDPRSKIGGASRGHKSGCFPGLTRSTRCRRVSSIAPATRRPRWPRSPSASPRIPCGTALQRTCSAIAIATAFATLGSCSSDSSPPFVGDPKCFRNSDDGHLRLRQAVRDRYLAGITIGSRAQTLKLASYEAPARCKQDGRFHSALSAEIVSSNFGSSRFAMALRPASPPPSPNS